MHEPETFCNGNWTEASARGWLEALHVDAQSPRLQVRSLVWSQPHDLIPDSPHPRGGLSRANRSVRTWQRWWTPLWGFAQCLLTPFLLMPRAV